MTLFGIRFAFLPAIHPCQMQCGRYIPDEILLAPNRMFMGFGVGRLGWAIIWGQNDAQTNQWKLDSNGDGSVKTVYAETRW